MSKKEKKKLNPLDEMNVKSQTFAINMYTFYLFQKSCTELMMADKVLEKAIRNAKDDEEIDNLFYEQEKNMTAWNMILSVEILSGSSCYAEA